MKSTAIILAGGAGKRMHSSIPKQLIEVKGRPLLYYTISAFEKSKVDNIILVVPEGEEEKYKNIFVDGFGFSKIMKIVSGGAERYDSVYNALKVMDDDSVDNVLHKTKSDSVDNVLHMTKSDSVDNVLHTTESDSVNKELQVMMHSSASDALKMTESDSADKELQAMRPGSASNALKMTESDSDFVLVHDGARAFIEPHIINKNITLVQQYDAVITAMPVKDTIKIADGNAFVESTPNRETLWQIQTPQTFRTTLLKECYEKLYAELVSGTFPSDVKITDDSMVVERYSDIPVKLIEGSYENIKVTTPDDILVAERLL